MKLPRNGSAMANSLLVTAGVVLGAVITWLGYLPSANDRTAMNSRAEERGLSGLTDGLEGKGSQVLIDSALLEFDPRVRANLMRLAGERAAGEDLGEALRVAGDFESQQDRLDFHRGLFGRWADEDPIAALNHAKDKFLAGSLQSEAIGIVINKWAADNPHEAWIWSDQNLGGPLKERAQTDLMIGWTRRSPEIASEWLVDSGLTSQPMINAVARTWAEQDPRRAADWAGLLPIAGAQQVAEVAVAGEWASQDPAAAAEFYTEAVGKEEGVNLAIALTDVWGTTDPAATADWISSLPAGASRDQSAAALATVWAASDIAAAVEWGTGLSDGGMREQVIAHLGTTWGAIEPIAAIDWLTSLPASEAADGLTGAFYSWAGTAPVQLGEWIAADPPVELGDRARLSLGDVLTSSDVPAAMDLALGMSSSNTSDEALGRFFREWRKTDDASAQDWVDANWSRLSGSGRERLNQEQLREVPLR